MLGSGAGGSLGKYGPGVHYAVPGMGDVRRREASGSMRSRAPRIPLGKTEGAGRYYGVKGGVGEVQQKGRGSFWTRPPTQPREAVLPRKNANAKGAVVPTSARDPLHRIPNSSRASFSATSSRLPHFERLSCTPGPGHYASPLISMGMMV